MSHSFPYYHQLDAMDCGPTSLRMVAKHYGQNLRAENQSSELCPKLEST